MVVKRLPSASSAQSKCRVTATLTSLLLLICTWAFIVIFRVCCSRSSSSSSSSSSSFSSNSIIDYRVESDLVAAWPFSEEEHEADGQNLLLRNVVFAIASSRNRWPERKEFVKLWWRDQHTRGFVWQEEEAGEPPTDPWDEDVPPIRCFTYMSSIFRRARILSQTLKMNLEDVKWFVLCDDDTIFSLENLIRLLSNYDPSQMHYIGSVSESHEQNIAFSYDMAYAGGGLAISYPLAKAVSQMHDKCSPELSDSNDWLHTCISQLGVPLTTEPGFHQLDIFGNALGILSAHPIAPFVSMHHVDMIDPVFPNLSALQGLQLLSKAMRTDPSNFLQQTICYNRKQGISVSVSSGYVVKVFGEIIYPRMLERAEITFRAWNSKKDRKEFDMDTSSSNWICKQPVLFYLDNILSTNINSTASLYKRHLLLDYHRKLCWSRRILSPAKLDTVRVRTRPLDRNWYKVPRRQCCHLGPIQPGRVLDVSIFPCGPGQTVVGQDKRQR